MAETDLKCLKQLLGRLIQRPNGPELFNELLDEVVSRSDNPTAVRRQIDEIRRQSQERSAERSERLSNQLVHSILPLFVVDERGHPVRRGSCVLVEVDDCRFALTANHVFNNGDRLLHTALPPRGPLQPLPYSVDFVARNTELDAAVLPLRRSDLEALGASTFLRAEDISENHHNVQDLGLNSYFTMGYPESRNYARINLPQRRVRQTSFQVTGLAAPPEAYLEESLDPSQHLAIEFDREHLRYKGTQIVGPHVQGMSGGGIFHLRDRTDPHGSPALVGIGIKHRRAARLLIGTRIEHFMQLARGVVADNRQAFA